MAPPDTPLLLVTGATGAVGPAVVREAVAQGFRVRTLTRHAPPAGLLPPHVDARLGDIGDPETRRRALDGVARVIHLAALLHLVDPAAQARAGYDAINVDGTSALGRDAIAAGVTRLVFFSSISVYGDTAGRIATEDTPVAPETPYARSKAAAESVVLALGHGGEPAGTVLRLAAVYGGRLTGNYRAFVRYLASYRPLPILPGGNRRTLVFDEDAARAAVLAAAHPAAAGRRFNVTDGAIHTLAEITGAICNALGRRPPAAGVPIRVAKAGARLARPLLRGPLGRIPAMVDKYAEDAAVDGRRIQQDLGFTPLVGLREGWERTVRALRREDL